MALKTSLVAHWKLEEASGNRADSSGNGTTLTDNNTVTSNPGKVGTAAQFTAASSEWLSAADNASVSMGDIDFTVAAWLYYDSLPAGNIPAVVKWSAGTDGLGDEYFLSTNGSNQFVFFLRNAANTANGTVTGTTFGALSTGTWYYVMAGHDAANDLLFISVNNGARDTAAHTTGGRDGGANFTIGSWSGGSSDFFNGRIDEVSLWKKVVTTTDRDSIYNSGNGLAFDLWDVVPGGLFLAM